eukprot:9931746-Alexandrium_andersonii.AAC.1
MRRGTSEALLQRGLCGHEELQHPSAAAGLGLATRAAGGLRSRKEEGRGRSPHAELGQAPQRAR